LEVFISKVLIKKNLSFIKNILLSISEEYVSYEYAKTLSDIEKDTITRNKNDLSLIKRQIKY